MWVDDQNALMPDRRLLWRVGGWRIALTVLLLLLTATVQMLGWLERVEVRFYLLPLFMGLILGGLWTWQAVQQLRQQRREALMARLIEAGEEAFFLCSRDRFLFISPQVEALVGYPADVLATMPTFFEQRIVEPEDRSAWRAYWAGLWQTEFLPSKQRHRFRIHHPYRGRKWLVHEADCFEFDGERLCRCVLRDVSESVALRQMVEALRERDRLTGLVHRHGLFSQCESLHEEGTVLTCLMLDVEDLSRINVCHGVEVGDAVLAELGQRIQVLQKKIPALKIAARWTSDNMLLFVLLDEAAVARMLPEWLAVLERQVFVEKQRLLVEIRLRHAQATCSLYGPLQSETLESIIHALYLRLHPHRRVEAEGIRPVDDPE